MGNEFKGEAAHSADYFGDTRDHWWNRDYLKLLGERWGLGAVHEALDVGCGVGHWGMLLGEQLSPDAWVIGVDREPRWVEKAAERAAARGLGGHSSGIDTQLIPILPLWRPPVGGTRRAFDAGVRALALTPGYCTRAPPQSRGLSNRNITSSVPASSARPSGRSIECRSESPRDCGGALVR